MQSMNPWVQLTRLPPLIRQWQTAVQDGRAALISLGSALAMGALDLGNGTRGVVPSATVPIRTTGRAEEPHMEPDQVSMSKHHSERYGSNGTNHNRTDSGDGDFGTDDDDRGNQVTSSGDVGNGAFLFTFLPECGAMVRGTELRYAKRVHRLLRK